MHLTDHVLYFKHVIGPFDFVCLCYDLTLFQSYRDGLGPFEKKVNVHYIYLEHVIDRVEKRKKMNLHNYVIIPLIIMYLKCVIGRFEKKVNVHIYLKHLIWSLK